MTFAKRFGIKLLATVFTFSIFGMAVVTATNSVFGTPDKLKSSLSEGKVYDAIANSIVDQAIADADAKSDIPLDNPVVQKAAKAAVTPELIQQNGEKIIDGTYNWLEGDTPTPDFKLNASDIKKQVATNVSNAAFDRVSKLPACTLAELEQININDIDPFTLKCRPPGVKLASLRAQYAQKIAASDELLADETVTAQDVKDEHGENMFSGAEEIPTAFQLGQKLSWIFGILAILSAIGIVFLHETKVRGLRSLAISLLIAGIILLVSLLATSFVIGLFKPAVDSAESAAMQDAVLSVVRALAEALNQVLLIFAIVYTVVGIGGLIGLHFAKTKTSIVKTPEQGKDPEPKTDSDKPAEK